MPCEWAITMGLERQAAPGGSNVKAGCLIPFFGRGTTLQVLLVRLHGWATVLASDTSASVFGFWSYNNGLPVHTCRVPLMGSRIHRPFGNGLGLHAK
ncbi:hypothetical protein GCM10009595_08380 [Falsarthrobacter nasiphocae]